MIVYVSSACTYRQTDRQTDRRTDGRTDGRTRIIPLCMYIMYAYIHLGHSVNSLSLSECLTVCLHLVPHMFYSQVNFDPKGWSLYVVNIVETLIAVTNIAVTWIAATNMAVIINPCNDFHCRKPCLSACPSI